MANNDIVQVKEDDMQERSLSVKEQLRRSPEVLKIASTVDVRNSNAILEYGNQPAQEISKFADQILRNIKTNTVESSSVMIRELTTIMKKFDKQDFEDKPEGFFGKMFNKPAKAVEKIMGKIQNYRLRN